MISRIQFLTGLCCLLFVALQLNATDIKKLVPTADELAEFKLTEEPMYYNADNLWDYINGAAPSYLAYGFNEVVTFILMHQQDSTEFVVDIYEMADTLNAFGIYSIEKAPQAESVAIGSQAFQAGNTLFFWQDKYYVKLIAYDDSPAVDAALTKIGKTVSQKLPQNGRQPHLFTVFPRENQIKGSERYQAQDVLGQSYLKNGFRLNFQQGDQTYFVFLIQSHHSEATRDQFQKYQNYIQRSGQITDKALNLGEEAFAGTDDYYGKILFARQGVNIIGVLGHPQPNRAPKIIQEMFSRL